MNRESYLKFLDTYIEKPRQEKPRPKEFVIPYDGFIFLAQLLQNTTHEGSQAKKALVQKAQKASPHERWYHLLRIGHFDSKESFIVELLVDFDNELQLEIEVRGGTASLKEKFVKKEGVTAANIRDAIKSLTNEMHTFVVDSINTLIGEEKKVEFSERIAMDLKPEELRENVVGILNGTQNLRRKHFLGKSRLYWDSYWDTRKFSWQK